MHVIHPAAPVQGILPEDVFDIVNDQGVRCGRGHVVYRYMPAIYPDRPVNIYFTMESTPEAEYMLFGALMARARQLRQQHPQEMARVYTSADPRDTRLMNFCLHNGMTVGNSEDLVAMQAPQDGGQDTFNCVYAPIPLNTLNDYHALAARLQQNGLGHITSDYLQALARNPVFVALGFYYGKELAGECIISGAAGRDPELAAIYILPHLRRGGMGARLLKRAMFLLVPGGVRTVLARIMSASQPQSRLVRAFGGQVLSQTLLFPGMDL